MQILIADDSATDREMLRLLLKGYGTCTATESAEEAVRIIEQSYNENSPFALICMDYMLPSMDGAVVVQRIRQLEKDHKILAEAKSKVVMVTAHRDIRQVLRCTDAGCDGYLTKPLVKDVIDAELLRLKLLVPAEQGKFKARY